MNASTTAAPRPADARARQLAAIDDSGWGERFTLFQPRNAMFWLFAWALVTGVVHSVDYYRQDVANYGGALIGGGVAFAIYGAVWLAFLGATNRYTPESPKLLATGFAWGAIVATGTLALSANGALLSLYAKLFGQSWASDWAAGFTAPVTEEFAKALGLLVLLGLAPRLIRSAYDAFVVGAFIGLGFQIWENVLYVYQGAQSDFGTNETTAALQVIGIRSISGIASHAMFSAIFCTGLFWALGWGAERRQVAKGLGLMLIAMAGHFTWDDTGALGAKLFGDLGAGPLMPLLIVIDVA
ncbi:MAG TPA: PrsW family intramembrane metalloprotease, partial [Acidimicrobiia bacterium]|nr:PrsW family intramembrane metalloprotease [Acidimicrobiia bacterium]